MIGLELAVWMGAVTATAHPQAPAIDPHAPSWVEVAELHALPSRIELTQDKVEPYPVSMALRNLTLAVDEDVLREARKLALDRSTTVNQLVRDHLTRLVQEEGLRAAALVRLRARMDRGILVVGPRTWSREDLHER